MWTIVDKNCLIVVNCGLEWPQCGLEWPLRGPLWTRMASLCLIVDYKGLQETIVDKNCLIVVNCGLEWPNCSQLWTRLA